MRRVSARYLNLFEIAEQNRRRQNVLEIDLQESK